MVLRFFLLVTRIFATQRAAFELGQVRFYLLLDSAWGRGDSFNLTLDFDLFAHTVFNGLLLNSSLCLLLITEQVHSHVLQFGSLVDFWFEGEALNFSRLSLFNIFLSSFSVHFAFVQQPILHRYAHALRHCMCFMQFLQHFFIGPLDGLFRQVLAGRPHSVLLELGAGAFTFAADVS